MLPQGVILESGHLILLEQFNKVIAQGAILESGHLILLAQLIKVIAQGADHHFDRLCP
jgi:hypothetical protein